MKNKFKPGTQPKFKPSPDGGTHYTCDQCVNFTQDRKCNKNYNINVEIVGVLKDHFYYWRPEECTKWRPKRWMTEVNCLWCTHSSIERCNKNNPPPKWIIDDDKFYVECKDFEDLDKEMAELFDNIPPIEVPVPTKSNTLRVDLLRKQQK